MNALRGRGAFHPVLQVEYFVTQNIRIISKDFRSMKWPPHLPRPIASQDTYSTPPGRQGRSVFWSTLRFYPRLVKLVLTASRHAKRGTYSSENWSDDSMITLLDLEASGCSIVIEGMRNIAAAKGPVVFIGNHMSTCETFLLPGIIDPVKPVTFVIKPSLMEYPIFGPVMRSRNPIVVSRDNPRQDLVTVLEEGKARLDAGISVVLFPQTTRVRAFDAAKFNTLGVKLARSAGVQVVPFALKTDAWANGSFIKEFGHIDPKKIIHFHFGAPVAVTGNGKDAHESIVRFIGDTFTRWLED